MIYRLLEHPINEYFVILRMEQDNETTLLKPLKVQS